MAIINANDREILIKAGTNEIDTLFIMPSSSPFQSNGRLAELSCFEY